MVSKVKLGSLLSLLTDYHANGAYKKLKENVELFDEPDYAVMIRTTNFEQGCFDSNLKYISEHAYNFLAKSKVQTGDIIMNKIANAGNSYLMPELNCPVSLAMNLFLLRIDEEKANSTFVYLYLKLNEAYVKSFANGSVTKTITKDAVRNLEIELPDRSIQNYIVKVYMAYTNKLTLNHQTNQTLEQMAQTLFKSWFVDFDPVFDNVLAKANNQLDNLPADFPEELHPKAVKRLAALSAHIPTQAHENEILGSGHESDNTPLPHPDFPSEFEFNEQLGWVPLGWEVVTFESLITLIGGGTPKTSIEEYWNGDIPWFSVVDAPNDSDVFVIDTDKYVTQLGVDKSSTKILRAGTTIISARGTVGKCAFVGTPMAMNQSCYGINGINSISDEYIYFLTRHQVSDLQKRGHGSVFNTITRETFKSILLPFSGDKLTIEFSHVVKALFDKILINNKQNIELTKLRDTLLPKLISGELQLNDIQG